MKLLINGSPRETNATTLAEVLVELELDEAVVATAINGEFVATGARPAARLQAGDAIEIVAPMQGG